jgi:hypothetical protein
VRASRVELNAIATSTNDIKAPVKVQSLPGHGKVRPLDVQQHIAGFTSL